MTTTIYTYGYGGKHPEELEKIVAELNATIFDVRFSPRSRNPAWLGKRLRERFGDRYQHVKAFGNANYKGGDILIVDYEAGKALIEQSERAVILVCVCKDPVICHRTYIAKKLVEEGFTVEELTTYRIQEVLKCSTQLPLLLNGLA